MVGARVLSDDENRIGLLEILQKNGALADATAWRMAMPLASWHMLEQSGKLLVP